MNWALGFYHPSQDPLAPSWVTPSMRKLVAKTTADIRAPGSAQCFVFLDEREDSLMDSHFFLHPDGFRQGTPASYRIVGYPGSYHHGTGNLGFADGHCEPRKWRDPRTMPRLVQDHHIVRSVDGVPSPGNPDVRWLQERTFQRGD